MANHQRRSILGGDHNIVELSPDAAVVSQTLRNNLGPELGTVVWLPARRLPAFPDGKDRFWLVVGLERTVGGKPGLVHLAPGSTKPSRGPTILDVEAGECALYRAKTRSRSVSCGFRDQFRLLGGTR